MVTDNVSVGMAYNFVRLEVESSHLVSEESGGIYSMNLAAGIDLDNTIDAHIVKATLNYHF
jgi:opacity protein-like surface antigen